MNAVSKKALSEAIYKALPYSFSESEKRRRLVIDVTNNKISHKLLRRIRFFMKILEHVSVVSLVVIGIFYVFGTMSPEEIAFIQSILDFSQRLVKLVITGGKVPLNQVDPEVTELILLWQFLSGL